jgi:hypothetical protein
MDIINDEIHKTSIRKFFLLVMFSLILRSRFSIHVFQADFDISVGEGKFNIIADKAVVIGEFSRTEY